MRKTTTCECCGIIGTVPEVFRYGYAECRKCRKDKAMAKRQSILNRPCKTCGKPVSTMDKRQITCSKKCGWAGNYRKREKVACKNCGKIVVRKADYVSQVKWITCGDECQRVISGKVLREKRDNRKHSLKAKVAWYKAQSRKRAANGWHRVLLNWSRQRHGPTKEKSWDDKLRAMIAGNMHREAISVVAEVIQKPKRKSRRRSAWIDKWNEACSEMILLFNREQKKEHNKDPWINKLNNWQSNHGTRMRIKAERSRLKDCEAY